MSARLVKKALEVAERIDAPVFGPQAKTPLQAQKHLREGIKKRRQKQQNAAKQKKIKKQTAEQFVVEEPEDNYKRNLRILQQTLKSSATKNESVQKALERRLKSINKELPGKKAKKAEQSDESDFEFDF
eukprot:comp91838_c0_seq1/m.48585 comp91838_c0_seq1/g.48585  ORF comp91838_c0_seq1/g.48585 comp91838_c0_seq1/m.48585 type:complete len:129 (-) comp91838_c0_seq1:92-478(-)